jgi:2-polyprenyl-6-methoxyphenol hydroxylase-like FAD-dependent oxidoreductase
MNIRPVRVDSDIDVLVVGAGPAGVALALRLRRLGYEVVLVSPKTPRLQNAHEFETFTPVAQDQLRRLGLCAALEAGYRGRVESEICWRTDQFEPRAPSHLVHRGAFLGALRQCAFDADVMGWDGTASAIDETESGWRVTLTSSEG